MPARIPADRIGSVIAAAAQVFVAHGYRRAQVQDVADVLGVAKGTVYGYAQGKEALLAAAIRYGDGIEPVPSVGDLPLPTPEPGSVATLVAERLGAEVSQLAVVRALSAQDPDRGVQGVEGVEGVQGGDLGDLGIGDIVADLYARLARHRVAIKIVDRCAPELPELGQVWFGAGRQAQVSALQSYLADRERSGHLGLPGPAALVARTLVEICALWAVHCHFDPTPGRSLGASAGGELRAGVGSGIDDGAVSAMLAAIFTRATTLPRDTPTHAVR